MTGWRKFTVVVMAFILICFAPKFAGEIAPAVITGISTVAALYLGANAASKFGGYGGTYKK